MNKIILIVATAAAVSGSIHHGHEESHHDVSSHHVEPLAVKQATIVKQAPIAVHSDAHYSHGYEGHSGHGHQGHGSHGHHGHEGHEGHNCYQRYKFGYKILDKYGNKQAREEEADEYNNRKGYYSFIDHDGLHRKVEYVADKHGFRATVITNEPGTAKQHPAHINMLAKPLKIDHHHVKSHGIAHGGYGEDHAQAALDPRGAVLEAASVGHAPLVKQAAVVEPVAIAKVPVAVAAPVGIVKAAPIAVHDAHSAPLEHSPSYGHSAPLEHSPSYGHSAPLEHSPSYGHSAPLVHSPSYAHAAHVHAAPAHVSFSKGHTHESQQYLGHGHHYAPAAQSYGYAPQPSGHISSGYLEAVGHRSHGLAHQASYSRAVAVPVPYGVRMMLVTGGYRGSVGHKY